MSDATSLKIAYIGGGSRQWARAFMADLALASHLTGELVLHDLNRATARKNTHVGADLFSRPESVANWRVTAEPHLTTALHRADVVMLSIEPGPVTMRYADLGIPQRHGILQPVGDTVEPGGLMRALRVIPTYVEFARAIAEHCLRAWVIHYTNPMTLCTAALHVEFSGIKVLGCCHEVFGTQRFLADLVAKSHQIPATPREEIDLDIAGINHFTWATRAGWRGQDLFPLIDTLIGRPRAFANASRRSRANQAAGRWFAHSSLVALDLFRRYSALRAAGDRHLVEFLPEYSTDTATLHRWGIIATPYRWRLQHRAGPDETLPTLRKRPLKPSGEEGVRMLEALFGHGDLRSSINLSNRGQMPGLPTGAVVETMACFSSGALTPQVPQALPSAALNRVRHISCVQTLVLEAALQQDLSAVLVDPLCHGSVDRLHKMFRHMIKHCHNHLRGWNAPSIPEFR
ncbi:MAG: hypothetical protein J6386_02420 [Candidatus Synoicihabitans palmerolidicus]|nr:hypothetical protein [Candidatus Synoicihabitans palmerolidicus]